MTERSVYTKAVEDSKRWIKRAFPVPPSTSYSPMSRINECRHLSFDFAQNSSYPYNPLQPGPLYFLCERKVYIFGVCCEAIPQQINYLIDECVYSGKGANTIVSLIHYYLTHHTLGERHLHLHADNCVGQNKNNTLLRVSFQIVLLLLPILSSIVPGMSWLAILTQSSYRS